MANIKSAKKRILVTKTKNERNKAIKSGVKTAVKKVYAAVEAGDKAAANAAKPFPSALRRDSSVYPDTFRIAQQKLPSAFAG